MAEFYIGRRSRRTKIPKPVYLAEARAAANAAGQILVAQYGEHPWILQIMEAVQQAVDRGVKQLSGSQAPTANAMPGDIQSQGYVMPARTAEDVSPNFIAAPSDNPAPNQRDVEAAMAAGTVDMFAQLARVADPAPHLGQPIPNQPMPQPPQAIQASPSGLILPAGAPPQQVNHEGPSARHGGDTVSWLL